MKENLKRGVSFLLSIVLAFSMVLPYNQVAFAEELDEQVHSELVEEYGTNYLITMCAGSISNYEGELTCELSEPEQQCTVFVTVANNNVSSSEMVDCFFELPNGNSYALGMVHANGGTTASLNFGLLPAGEYKFYFEATTAAEIELAGYIYE